MTLLAIVVNICIEIIDYGHHNVDVLVITWAFKLGAVCVLVLYIM